MLFLLSWLGWLVSQSAPQNAAPVERATADHVRIRLSVADDKKTFRIGERIELVLTFTVDRPGYFVTSDVPARELPLDQIEISPSTAVVRWVDDYVALHRPFRDVISNQIFDAEHPVHLSLPLNYWFRFDQPGEYLVHLTTNRVGAVGFPDDARPPVKTNAVTLRILPMSEQEEADEVRKLAAELDTLTTKDFASSGFSVGRDRGPRSGKPS